MTCSCEAHQRVTARDAELAAAQAEANRPQVGDLRVYDGERWLKPSWHVPTRAVVYEDEHVVVLKKLPS